MVTLNLTYPHILDHFRGHAMSGREESRANHSLGKREIPLGLARWQMGG